MNDWLGEDIHDGILLNGMIVRFPNPNETLEQTSDFRDYRIGWVTGIDEVEDIVQITAWEFAPGSNGEEKHILAKRKLVKRCLILPKTRCYNHKVKKSGLLLAAVQDGIPYHDFVEYFVLIGGNIERIPESHLWVGSHRQDVNPVEQLKSYEFHNPTYRYYRDQFVESYTYLRNATTGLEELVNTRVLLLAHQAEVITRVLSDDTCRYILADEVGLGKTIEASVILKGLLERHGKFKTLVIAPSSISQQWHHELDDKFWLRLPLWHSTDITMEKGLIVTQEELETDSGIWAFVQRETWGLIILDEAHHVPRRPLLYDRIHHLSKSAQRFLILSATPIQHRSKEYLALLRLMHPDRYNALTETDFARIVANQKTIYDVIETVHGSLNPDYFSVEEFVELTKPLCDALATDQFLAKAIEDITHAHDVSIGLRLAQKFVAYVSENYRIESRVIRNRRITFRNVLLPERILNNEYAYKPGEIESDILVEIQIYIQHVLSKPSLYAASFCEALVHSAASSPNALAEMIQRRIDVLGKENNTLSSVIDPRWLHPTSPRQETLRLDRLAYSFITDTANEELRLLENLKNYVNDWNKQTIGALDSAYTRADTTSSHRLVQVLRAVSNVLERHAESKVLIFTSWGATLNILKEVLRTRFGSGNIAEFHTLLDQEKLQDEADRFQNDPRCRIMLCDELGGEGRNFQIASTIIHVDLPWSPSHIEQRIGRVDRLGREGVVPSIVIYAKDQLEEDLFELMESCFHMFTQSMSGMEIIIEDIRDEIRRAFMTDPFEGLKKLIPRMSIFATNMRKEIETERIFEESAINLQLRQEIMEISQKYQNGEELRKGICNWGIQIGMENSYNPTTQIVTFFPKKFNFKSMTNAKLADLPNMEDALKRSRRTRQLIIKGTFNRNIAVRREDLVFFAPNSDEWTNTILKNAMESERGRCSAISIQSPLVELEWQGFEYLFSLQPDPRPLLAQGLSTIHLYKSRGILAESIYRIYIGIDGQILGRSHPVSRAIREVGAREGRHLGRRADGSIDSFREDYPEDEWRDLVSEISQKAFAQVRQVFDLEDESYEFGNKLEQQHITQSSVRQWLATQGIPLEDDDSKLQAQISQALIEGIRHPMIRLESACFWKVSPKYDRFI